MSRGRHARDGQRRDAWRAAARDTWTRAARWLRRSARNLLWAAGDWLCSWPRPGDHQRRASAARSGPGQPSAPGAVAAGTGTSAGDSPPPAAALPATPSGESAATLPRPVPGPPAGRAGAARPAWVIFPDDRAALMQAGQVSISGLHARHRPPVTEPIRISVVRPYYPAAEARRDSTARWGA